MFCIRFKVAVYSRCFISVSEEYLCFGAAFYSSCLTSLTSVSSFENVCITPTLLPAFPWVWKINLSSSDVEGSLQKGLLNGEQSRKEKEEQWEAEVEKKLRWKEELMLTLK